MSKMKNEILLSSLQNAVNGPAVTQFLSSGLRPRDTVILCTGTSLGYTVVYHNFSQVHSVPQNLVVTCGARQKTIMVK